MTFDPFESRACRDVRNQLGVALVSSIRQQSYPIFSNAFESLANKSLPIHISDYMNNRKSCLKIILKAQDQTDNNPDQHSEVLMWNHRLFFEFHEWFEIRWSNAQGNTKKGYQALVLSAVIYEHLQYNRIKSARNLTPKTIHLLEQYQHKIPPWIRPELFIKNLKTLDFFIIKSDRVSDPFAVEDK